MDLRQVRYFVAVYEEGSFSRAAVRENCTQPGLSVQVAQLETMLEQRLFDRNPRGDLLAARAVTCGIQVGRHRDIAGGDGLVGHRRAFLLRTRRSSLRAPCGAPPNAAGTGQRSEQLRVCLLTTRFGSPGRFRPAPARPGQP